MELLFWLPGFVAAALAFLLPFPAGLAAVIVLAPVSNAYVAAGAMGILLLRWLWADLPGIAASRTAVAWAWGIGGYIVLGLALSALTSSNLLRLATESAQWMLGAGMFIATVLSMGPELRRTIVRALAASAVLIAATQAALWLSGWTADESSSIPMLTWPNNYVSILGLFGLVVLPNVYPDSISAKWRLPLLVIAIAAMFFNQSRAALLLSALVLAGWMILRRRNPAWIVPIAGLMLAVMAGALIVAVRGALADPAGVASLGDFQTNYSNLERLGILIYAWELFVMFPFGSGIGSSSDLFINNPYTVGAYPDAHNMLAMLAVELGWLGVIGYAALAFFLARQALSGLVHWNPVLLFAAALLLTTIYDALLFNGILAAYFWIYLAVLVAPPAAGRLVHLVMYPAKA